MVHLNDIALLTLVAHLEGAAAAAVLTIASFVALYRKTERHYRALTVSLAWSAGFQVISGAVLTLLHLQETSLLQFCGRIGVYIAVIGFTEAMFYLRMNSSGVRAFPSVQVSLPFAGSMLIAAPVFIILLARTGF